MILRIKFVVFLMVFTVLYCHAFPAAAIDIPGYSGMAQISDNTFLTVNDRKNPIHSGYRLGVLQVTAADGVVFTPISVRDWMDDDKDPSDLEACCRIPGREGEFLIAESGYFNGRFGRIFHVTLFKDKEGLWSAAVNKAFRIYSRKLNAKNRSYKGDQVEGIACFHANGKTMLVYGERGGGTQGGKKVGTIVWGTINFESYRFDQLGEAPLVDQSVLGDRDCSALRLEADADGTISVLSVATRDADDNGPFQSALYRAGRFIIDAENKTVHFERYAKPEVIHKLSGLKVEAISGPAGNAPDSKNSIATDDEHFGGIWRPLFGE